MRPRSRLRAIACITAPVNYGAGPVKPNPPTFSNCPQQPPASMTINSRGDIYADAAALASFIAYLHTHDGVRTIRIVAHSYGGLWTRGAMRLASAVFPGVTVESITTLGTPHLGSFMADIAEAIDPGFCGQDTTCKVLAYLVIAAKDATFEPALSQVTAVSLAQWNPGQGASLSGIPVSAIAGDAVSLPGITNPYVSPNDVLVGLRSAQAAGLKGPGVIPQLSCFAPFPDVHSTTFLPLFPNVRYALPNDPAIATDVEQTLAGTPAPNPCPSSAAAGAATHDVTAALRTGSSALGTGLPRRAGADDAIVLRTGTTVTCRGRAVPSIPLLYSKTPPDHSPAQLRGTHRRPGRVSGSAVRPRHGRLGHPAPEPGPLHRPPSWDADRREGHARDQAWAAVRGDDAGSPPLVRRHRLATDDHLPHHGHATARADRARRGHAPRIGASAPHRAVTPDQRVRRAVVLQIRLVGRLELRDDPLGERLTELDAPLVERIDPPDDALREHAVLIEGDELAECRRVKHVGEQDVRRTVPLHHAMGHDRIRRALGAHLLLGLPERERLGLREHV